MEHHASKLTTAHVFQQLVHHLLQCQPLVEACTNQYVIAEIAYAALDPTTYMNRRDLMWVMRAGDMRLVRVASKAYQAQSIDDDDDEAQHNTHRSWFRTACRHGHLPLAQWLHTTFQLTNADVRTGDNAALRWACSNGHLSVAQWLHTTFQLTDVDASAYGNYALRGACMYGHLSIAQWLRITFHLA